MAVGFGINLASSPTNLGRPTIAVADLAGETIFTPTDLLTELDSTFRARMTALAEEGFAPVRQDWLDRTVHTGGALTYTYEGEPAEGDFLDLAMDGALVVRDASGTTRHIRAGDVGLIG